jgi:large subunit ribosomal protein L27e
VSDIHFHSLKPGKVVILLNGRFAGKKAVIVKNFEEGAKGRRFSHVLVAGIDRYPKKVAKTMSKKKILKKSKVKPFLKHVNLQHVMPTRYTVDIDLKNAIKVGELKEDEKKTETKKEIKKLFEEKYLAGNKAGTGNAWFFEKLRF